MSFLDKLKKKYIKADETFTGTVDYYHDTRELGVVTLDKPWYNLDRVDFSGEAVDGGSLKRGDKVELTIKGGRKRPIVQTIRKV